MAIKTNQLNPLGVLELRRLNYIPDHFAKIQLSNDCDIQLLNNWINYNLNSRYAITMGITLAANNKIQNIMEIGLEDPKELSMLLLGCPFLIRKER